MPDRSLVRRLRRIPQPAAPGVVHRRAKPQLGAMTRSLDLDGLREERATGAAR